MKMIDIHEIVNVHYKTIIIFWVLAPTLHCKNANLVLCGSFEFTVSNYLHFNFYYIVNSDDWSGTLSQIKIIIAHLVDVAGPVSN